MTKKPSIPKGTRDFLPEQALQRSYIFDTLRTVFQRHGYLPIETPAFERLDTLLGKYGEEGDKLIFKILNSGDFLQKVRREKPDLYDYKLPALAGKITEKALRYDLTVPFARFVVQHQNDLSFPFKRYQIQPVWRADNPQAGRYREFYQCDVDVVGSDGLLNEVELVLIACNGFAALGLPDVEIRINNRKVLAGLAEVLGEADKLIPFTVALDKLDKKGKEGVVAEMRENGISEEAVAKLLPVLEISGTHHEQLTVLREVLQASEIGLKGLDELTEVFEHTEALGVDNLFVDVTLARGLNYYTGAIFEVAHKEFGSSICGGGRYDDLTGVFGKPGLSGVGISFGADRIYDLMLKKGLFPDSLASRVDLLFVNFGPAEASHCMKLLAKAREAGINGELFPHKTKIPKQMKYADSKGVRFVGMVGSQEIENGTIRLKNMETGEQEDVTLEAMISQLKS